MSPSHDDDNQNHFENDLELGEMKGNMMVDGRGNAMADIFEALRPPMPPTSRLCVKSKAVSSPSRTSRRLPTR
jgi:hypothetical protein